jgi:hypothetical protein
MQPDRPPSDQPGEQSLEMVAAALRAEVGRRGVEGASSCAPATACSARAARPAYIQAGPVTRHQPHAPSGNGLCLALADDLVNDAGNRCGGVDDDAVPRDVFFRSMQARNELPFRLRPAQAPANSYMPRPTMPDEIVEISSS